MTIEQMTAQYIAQGGKVRRVAKGARAVPRKVMSDLTRDDGRRAAAIALWNMYRQGASK